MKISLGVVQKLGVLGEAGREELIPLVDGGEVLYVQMVYYSISCWWMYPKEHIWTILMHKKHIFYALLKINPLYTLYPESFCQKILLSRKFSHFLTLV